MMLDSCAAMKILLRLLLSFRGVAAVAERAFWDALGDGLRAEPPQWERLVVLLGDARDSLAALIPPGAPEGARLLASLSEKLDTVRDFGLLS